MINFSPHPAPELESRQWVPPTGIILGQEFWGATEHPAADTSNMEKKSYL